MSKKNRLFLVMMLVFVIILLQGCFEERPNGENLSLERDLTDAQNETLISLYEHYFEIYLSEDHYLDPDDGQLEQKKLIELSSNEPRDDLYNVYMAYMNALFYLRSFEIKQIVNNDTSEVETNLSIWMNTIYIFLTEYCEYTGEEFPLIE